LDWAYDKIGKPAFGRVGLKQKIINYASITGEMAHDDEISFNTQCGSQWDGFMHYADQIAGSYYNGVKHTDDVATRPEAHGIHREPYLRQMLRKFVLISRYRLVQAWNRRSWSFVGLAKMEGRHWPTCEISSIKSWLASFPQADTVTRINNNNLGITLEELESIAQHQEVSFEPGDILIIRTGFVKWYESNCEETRTEVFRKLLFTGVEQGEHVERWLWNNAFSAVGGDSVSWECTSRGRSCTA
jgi:hypothetical protein